MTIEELDVWADRFAATILGVEVPLGKEPAVGDDDWGPILDVDEGPESDPEEGRKEWVGVASVVFPMLGE
jgi:hypothetical protein